MKKKIQNKNIFRPTYPNFFDLRYLNTTIFFFWPKYNISQFFIFLSIYLLILDLELLPNSPLSQIFQFDFLCLLQIGTRLSAVEGPKFLQGSFQVLRTLMQSFRSVRPVTVSSYREIMYSVVMLCHYMLVLATTSPILLTENLSFNHLTPGKRHFTTSLTPIDLPTFSYIHMDPTLALRMVTRWT